MDFKLDREKYDELQAEFLNRIMCSIKDFLSEELQWRLELEQELDPDSLADLAESIGFAVNSVIDGSDVIGLDDAYMPLLTFKKREQVIYDADGSYLHEMTMGSLEEWLVEQLDDDQE